jgi:predicted SAM-dependent methyltransferase
MTGLLRDSIRRIPLTVDVYELVVSHRHQRPTAGKVQRLLASGHPIKIDLGGADAGHGGWSTIDVTDTCDLYWDLRRGIPFPDASVDAVYSSHFFEHLSFDQGQEMLRECMRVLRPGGSFSICVPNARIYLEAYLGLRDVPESFFQWAPAYHRTTAIDAANYVAYMAGEHKYMFDEENLLYLLRSAGFTNVRPRPMDPALDRPERDFESIYAEAVKP